MHTVPLAGLPQEFHQGPLRDLPRLSSCVTDGRRRDRSTLLEAYEASSNGSDQYDRSDAHEQMRRLDQPVPVPNPDHLLRDAKDRHDQCVDNADDAEPPQCAGGNRQDSLNQQCKGY